MSPVNFLRGLNDVNRSAASAKNSIVGFRVTRILVGG